MAGTARKILIPAMGSSRRFVEAGHKGHKALLTINLWGERMTMVERVLLSMPERSEPHVIIRSSDMEAFSRVVPERQLLPIHSESEGQAQTILWGLQRLLGSEDEPVAVHNCDMEIQSHVVASLLDRAESTVLVHEDKQEEVLCSYVNHRHFATRFEERRRITSWAQTGFWTFASGQDLIAAIMRQQELNQRHTNGEWYLSAALNHLPIRTAPSGHDYRMIVRQVGPSGWLDMGTPEAIARQGGSIG